jgi:hypothetical protein
VSIGLRVAAALLICVALTAERAALIPAPGLVLFGGLLLAGYLWFLAAAVNRSVAPPQRRRS